jgi:uncharacterized heparinase superfamily protein
MTRAKLAPMARMAVQLEPAQVVHRARLHAQRRALHRWPGVGQRLCPGPDPATAVGWPSDFRPVDARISGQWPAPALLRTGRIKLLGVAQRIGDPPDWEQAKMPLLWRFHLHYWDWAWGLAAGTDRAGARATFAQLWRSWRTASPFGRGDGWFSYPVALRAWSWCGLYHDLVAGSDIERSYVGELSVHAGFLRRHLETDVRGNHLIKNLKALAGLAVFFADERLLRFALTRLVGQLPDQVLSDGGHYERSSAYHCQVLADLIDVDGLIRASRQVAVPELTTAIARMRRWLGCVLGPDAKLPMLNDGYPVADGLLEVLRPESPPSASLLTMPATGLVRAQVGEWHLLADVGAPCPDGLPGHAHADTFGCLVHAFGAPLLVDTGTSTYEPGAIRDYERSTAAHNTVEVDGADSTEVWGAFRAGRRARVHGLMIQCLADGLSIAAEHDGFRALSGRPCHRRCWRLTETGLQVDDLVTGRGPHLVAVHWHLAPGTAARLEAGGAVATTAGGTFQIRITASRPVKLAVSTGQLAVGYQRTAAAPVLTCRLEAVLPVQVTTSWRQTKGVM